MELQAAIAEFILDRESLRRKPATIRFYRTHLGGLADFLADRDLVRIKDLTRSAMRAFFAHLNRRVEQGTAAAYDRAVRAFTRFCVLEGWLERDPMTSRPRITPPKGLPDTWEIEEVARLLATCGDDPTGIRDKAIMLLMLDTGLRAGEVVSLKPDCLKMDGDDRGTVRVRAEKAKSAKDRTVPFWSGTLSALSAWREIRPAEAGTVFVAADGHGRLCLEPLTASGLNQLIRRRVKQAGIVVKKRLCHIWRHTFAKMYVQNGGDLETLRRMLGHESLETVRIYLGFRDRDIAEKHFRLSPVRQYYEKTQSSPGGPGEPD